MRDQEDRIALLEEECERLRKEHGRAEQRLDELRVISNRLFASLTWRVAEWLNGVVSRLLGKPPIQVKASITDLLGGFGPLPIEIGGEDLVDYLFALTNAHFGYAVDSHNLLDSRSLIAQAESDLPFIGVTYLAHIGGDRSTEDAKAHWDRIGRRQAESGYALYRPFKIPPQHGMHSCEPTTRELLSQWQGGLTISVLMPVHKVQVRWLQAAVESVISQIYPHWELCIVDDASGDREISDYLESLDDDRIKVKLLSDNVGIAASTQKALEMATGDYVALLDHDDELTLDALWLNARVINEHDPDLIYSDEAKLDLKGNVVEPHFKPDFSPEMIQSQNYISHLGVYRRSLLNEVGGFRQGYEGSQDHEMLLRFLEQARSVYHIPRILYYWRKVPQSTASRFGAKNHAWDAGVKAIEDSLKRRGEAATVEKGTFPGTYRVRRQVPSEKVSIIIPFRDHADLLDQCLESIFDHTSDIRFEVIGVDNQSSEAQTAAVMDKWHARPEVQFVAFDAPFNYSAINNFAAKEATGQHLLLLNNDIEVIDDDWLSALLEFSQLPEVGAVGGRLLYPDNTLQHAGVILGIGGVAGHSHKYFPKDHHGYFCRPHLIQNVSAVTGACLMVKKSVFDELGGLDEENLTVAFNDIDFCLRAMEAGYRNVYTPYCTLYHHESKSRGAEDTQEKQARFGREAHYMRKRHLRALSLGDHFYNPNLTLDHENFEVRTV